MPVLDHSIQAFIEDSLIMRNKERSEKHEPSGLLSASMLYQPIRCQILKTIGVPRKPFDAYTLGKFKRGFDVEDWYVEQLEEMKVLVEAQKKVEYRGAIGFVDAIVDTSKMLFKDGAMPFEVKSVTNAKLRRIKQTGVDFHYKMQGCFYALGLEKKHYAIVIASGEDYRTTAYIFKTREMQVWVDRAISKYAKAMEAWNADKVLPKFEPHPQVKWTSNLKYAMFEEFWLTSPDSQVIKKMEELSII